MTRIPVEVFLEGSYAEEVSEETDRTGKTVYVARYRKLPGCVTQASSRDSALAALRASREPYIRKLYEVGADLPLPDFRNQPTVFVGSVSVAVEGQPEGPGAEGTQLTEGGEAGPSVDEKRTSGLRGAVMV